MPKKTPVRRQEKPIKTIVVISDLHVGSTVALMPDGFKTAEGNNVLPNAIQIWLSLCWSRANQFITDAVGDDPFALVLNGDLIEGIHHGTKQIWSPELADQKIAAVQLIQPLASLAEKVFIVKGTECHTGATESSIAEAVGAEMNRETGNRAFDRLTIEVNDIRHVFRHHIGTSMRRGLGGTQLSAVLGEEQVEAANNGEKIPRVVCCAHRHKYGLYQDDNGICVVSPPWQGLTRFAHKVVSQARPRPGVVIIDHRNKEFGELPDIKRRIYDAPTQDPIRL